MPPWAQCVLVSCASSARVTSVTGKPASASLRATVPPATPQPMISISVSISSGTKLPSSAPLPLAPTIHISLHRLGILLTGELLAVGYPHHIRIDLETVAVWIEEVERATTTAADAPSPFHAVDERPVN